MQQTLQRLLPPVATEANFARQLTAAAAAASPTRSWLDKLQIGRVFLTAHGLLLWFLAFDLFSFVVQVKRTVDVVFRRDARSV